MQGMYNYKMGEIASLKAALKDRDAQLDALQGQIEMYRSQQGAFPVKDSHLTTGRRN